eukprot:130319_1
MTDNIDSLQNKCNEIQQTIDTLQQSLQAIQNNDLQGLLKLNLLNIRGKTISLEDRYNSLKFENETLKYDINKLKQKLPQPITGNMKMDNKRSQIAIGNDKWSEKIFDILSSHNIQYTLLKHEAVYTCEQASKYDNQLHGASCKNLFLQDKKKKNYFILSALESTKFKLNDLKKKITRQHNEIKCGKLQFGKETTLNEKLKLIKGSVTPFGIFNDEKKETILLIDENLTKHKYVKFHPLVNTMTISLKFLDFIDLLKKLDYKFYVVKVD